MPYNRMQMYKRPEPAELPIKFQKAQVVGRRFTEKALPLKNRKKELREF